MIVGGPLMTVVDGLSLIDRCFRPLGMNKNCVEPYFG
jgi:hypothetical protein